MWMVPGPGQQSARADSRTPKAATGERATPGDRSTGTIPQEGLPKARLGLTGPLEVVPVQKMFSSARSTFAP